MYCEISFRLVELVCVVVGRTLPIAVVCNVVKTVVGSELATTLLDRLFAFAISMLVELCAIVIAIH